MRACMEEGKSDGAVANVQDSIWNWVNISPCKLWIPEEKDDLQNTHVSYSNSKTNSQIQHLLLRVHTLQGSYHKVTNSWCIRWKYLESSVPHKEKDKKIPVHKHTKLPCKGDKGLQTNINMSVKICQVLCFARVCCSPSRAAPLPHWCPSFAL